MPLVEKLLGEGHIHDSGCKDPYFVQDLTRMWVVFLRQIRFCLVIFTPHEIKFNIKQMYDIDITLICDLVTVLDLITDFDHQGGFHRTFATIEASQH